MRTRRIAHLFLFNDLLSCLAFRFSFYALLRLVGVKLLLQFRELLFIIGSHLHFCDLVGLGLGREIGRLDTSTAVGTPLSFNEGDGIVIIFQSDETTLCLSPFTQGALTTSFPRV